jgi:YrbI family 3-deoxy-D-manno-octulosonate 8-phosphate phosphatase
MKIYGKEIELIVTDFDGVLTDNRVLVDEDGKEAVWCNRSDGLAIEMFKKEGVEVIVISKEKNPVVAQRCKKLDIEYYQGIDKKIDLFKQVVAEKKKNMKNVCYIGNDSNDVDCLKEAGLAIVPADAYDEAKKVADHITKANGGEGILREILRGKIYLEKNYEYRKHS